MCYFCNTLMTHTFYFWLCLFSVLFASCKYDLSVQRRRYSSGVYVNVTKDKSEIRKNAVTVRKRSDCSGAPVAAKRVSVSETKVSSEVPSESGAGSENLSNQNQLSEDFFPE